MKTNFSKHRLLYSCLITGAVSVIFMLAVYALCGIYPFGTGTVVCDDMIQQTIPNYYYFWDFLHGGGHSVLFNWETAAGMQVLTPHFYLLKPWEVIFQLLVTRDGIVDGIALFLIFKFMMASLTMNFFLSKRFSLLFARQILLSFTYAFSSFLLIYYSNMAWIDTAFIFPLLIYAALYMKDTGKILPYVAVLTYTLLLTVYSSFMIFLFLLLVGGLYIIFLVPAETRKTVIVRFGFSSVVSLFLSAVINVPVVYYMFGSTRISRVGEKTENSALYDILSAENSHSVLKMALLLCLSSMLWAFAVCLFAKSKKNPKRSIFFGLSLFMLIIPSVCENINLIWHIGSYNLFPLRYLYMLSFLLVCSAAEVSGEMPAVRLLREKKALSAAALCAAAVSAAAGIYFTYRRVFVMSGISGVIVSNHIIKDNAGYIVLAFVLLLVCYLLLLMQKYKKAGAAIMSLVLLAETGICAYAAVGACSVRDGEPGVYSMNFIDDSKKLYDTLPLENDNITRMKNRDYSLNSNYPMMINYPSMSNFTHLASSELADNMRKMGYSQIFTRILDNSGTLLSDALLNIRYVMTKKDVSPEAYKFVADLYDGNRLYEANYAIPFGITVNDAFVSEDMLSSEDPFVNTNSIFNALGGKGTLIETEPHVFGGEMYETYKFTGKTDGTKQVYLKIDLRTELIDLDKLIISVDGEILDLSCFERTNWSLYPDVFYNNILDLGVMNDKEFEISLDVMGDVGGDFSVTAGYLDTAKLASVCGENMKHAEVTTGKRSLSAAVSADEGEYLFLPVANDRGWSIRVNGKKTQAVPALGSFIAVRLDAGENDVEMNFLPYGMKAGLLVSLAALLALAAVLVIAKKKPLAPEKDDLFLCVFEKVYIAGMCAVYALVYLLPIVCSIYFNLIKR